MTSLACAALAGASTQAYLARVGAAAALSGPETRVVTAAVPVARGGVLRAEELRLSGVPGRFAPPGALHQISQAVGRVALAALASGEVVTETRLARVRAGPVASLTPEGLRAFAVPTSLPRDAIDPGDRVDILATYGSGQPHTETVVAGVEVLLVLAPGRGGATGVPGVGGGDGTGASGATLVLVVSPDQEERLAFAAAFAALSVAIVPPGESASPSPVPSSESAAGSAGAAG